MVKKKTCQTLPQKERWRKPERQTVLRDIELVDLGAKPRYLKFLTQADIDRIPNGYTVDDEDYTLAAEGSLLSHLHGDLNLSNELESRKSKILVAIDPYLGYKAFTFSWNFPRSLHSSCIVLQYPLQLVKDAQVS